MVVLEHFNPDNFPFQQDSVGPPLFQQWTPAIGDSNFVISQEGSPLKHEYELVCMLSIFGMSEEEFQKREKYMEEVLDELLITPEFPMVEFATERILPFLLTSAPIEEFLQKDTNYSYSQDLFIQGEVYMVSKHIQSSDERFITAIQMFMESFEKKCTAENMPSFPPFPRIDTRK